MVSSQVSSDSTPNEQSETPESPIHERCLNCEAELAGPFCHVCGQRDVELERGLGDLVREFVHETFELDGRLPRSLKSLAWRPGELTAAYATGQRAKYTTPVRLYVFLALVGLFISKLLTVFVVDTAPESLELNESYAALQEVAAKDPDIAAKLQQGVMGEATDAASFNHEMAERVFDWMPVLMLVTLAFTALLLKLLYRRRSMETHLVFSLHFHAALLLIMLAGTVVTTLIAPVGQVMALSSLVQMLVAAVWGTVAMRRVYDQGWGVTVAKATLVWAAYIIVSMALSILAYTILLFM